MLGWIGHCFKDYEILVKGTIKGKLDLLFSAEQGKRNEMLTTNAELDQWIEKLNF